MKKIYKNFLVLSIVIIYGFLPKVVKGQSLEEIIHIKTNGEAVIFLDQKPILKDNKTMVPIREVFESLGFVVNYNDKKEEVDIYDRENKVNIPLNENYFYVNDTSVYTDTKAQIINGKTMLPLRAVSEALGSEVHWNQETLEASVFYSGEYVEYIHTVNEYYIENPYIPSFSAIHDKEASKNISENATYCGYIYENVGSENIKAYEEILRKEGFIPVYKEEEENKKFIEYRQKGSHTLYIEEIDYDTYIINFFGNINLDEKTKIADRKSYYVKNAFLPDYGFLYKNEASDIEIYEDKNMIRYFYKDIKEDNLLSYKELLIKLDFTLLEEDNFLSVYEKEEGKVILEYSEENKTLDIKAFNEN